MNDRPLHVPDSTQVKIADVREAQAVQRRRKTGYVDLNLLHFQMKGLDDERPEGEVNENEDTRGDEPAHDNHRAGPVGPIGPIGP